MSAALPPGLSVTFTPAPGSPWRVLPDADPAPVHVPITILESRRVELRKVWRQHPDGTWPDRPAASANSAQFMRHAREVPHGDVEALYTLVEGIAKHPRLCIIHGQPIADGHGWVPRRAIDRGNQPATVTEAPAWILWLDLDTLTIPGADVVEAPDLAVAAAVAKLGDPFADAGYIWWLSGGQRPDSEQIKLRLGFFLDRPYRLAELKRWAATCPVPLDTSLYSPAQIIYTARPAFLDAHGAPRPDWLPRRSGYVLGERETVSLPVPAAPEPRAEARPPADGVQRRDPTVLRPLVAAIQRATASGAPRHPAIFAAARTAGGYVAGGAVSREEALDALLDVAMASGSAGADRAVQDGLESGFAAPLYAPNPLDALPEAPAPDEYPTLSLDALAARVDAIIQDLIANPRHPDGTPRRVVIRAPAGFGKTRQAMDLIRDQHRVLWFVPTLGLAEEAAARLNDRPDRSGDLARFRPPAAIALRGRLAPDPANPDRAVMCSAKPGAVKALKDAGQARATKTLLCKAYPNLCPALEAGRCPYFRQMNSPAPVRVLAHNFLTLPKAEVLGDFADTAELAVIDESPLDALMTGGVWTDAELKNKSGPIGAWLTESALAAVAGEILHGAVIPENARPEVLAAIDARLAALESAAVPGAHPLMSDLEATAVINAWAPPDPGLMKMLLAAERYLNGERNTLWKGQSDGKPAIFHKAVLRAATIGTLPALFLDATANADIYTALFGDRIEFHGYDIPMDPDTEVVQIHDSTLYHRKLSAKPSGLIHRLAAWLMLHGGIERAGIVTHKDTLEAIRALLPGQPGAHYGALRGLDFLKSATALIVAGRPEAHVLDVEALARALWPRAALALGATQYTPTRGHYRMRDGRRVPVQVRQHPDPRVAACVQHVREENLIQAIGRGRFLRSIGQPRLLVVATSVPVPGLTVDRLVALDEVLPERRLSVALLAGQGVAPLAPAWLAEHCPDEFSTPGAAHAWVMDCKFSKVGIRDKDVFPENLPLKSPHGLRLVTYRLAGQRGGKPKVALTAHDLTVTARRLEACWATPIHTLAWREADTPPAEEAPIPDSIYTPTPPPADRAVVPEPTIRVGNLLNVFPNGFDARVIEPIAEEGGEVDDIPWPAARIAALIADGWHPVNARARAEAEWLWRHGPPTVHGLLKLRCPPTVHRPVGEVTP